MLEARDPFRIGAGDVGKLSLMRPAYVKMSLHHRQCQITGGPGQGGSSDRWRTGQCGPRGVGATVLLKSSELPRFGPCNYSGPFHHIPRWRAGSPRSPGPCRDSTSIGAHRMPMRFDSHEIDGHSTDKGEETATPGAGVHPHRCRGPRLSTPPRAHDTRHFRLAHASSHRHFLLNQSVGSSSPIRAQTSAAVTAQHPASWLINHIPCARPASTTRQHIRERAKRGPPHRYPIARAACAKGGPGNSAGGRRLVQPPDDAWTSGDPASWKLTAFARENGSPCEIGL